MSDYFIVEDALQDLGIPLFHDDQHGTAIVALAAIENACKVTGKAIEDISIVINGEGAAGSAIAKILRCIGNAANYCTPVKELLMCDSKGIVSPDPLNKDAAPKIAAAVAKEAIKDRVARLT
jgi:malate dehydrogenase (oxaloacetate-decarboxylating)